MQTSGAASLLLRLIYLAHALPSQAELGHSEACAGHHDEVSFVQQRMNHTTNLGPELEMEEHAFAEHAPQFRLEDAEALFDLGMRAVHDVGTDATLEEKGIALLQSLAKHHSVAGSATQETLKQAAEGLKNDLEERMGAEIRTEVAASGDWVKIDLSSGGKPGICWNFFGGKPLQCEVAPQMLPQDKGDYANKCERICADYSWCSGYGFGNRPKEVPAPVQNLNPVQQNQMMTVMEEVTYGLVASVSARDFRVWPADADIGEPGSNFPYQCTARYSDPTSRHLFPSRFTFDQLAPVKDKTTGNVVQKAAKCFHVDDKPLFGCKVKVDDFWSVDKKGYKMKSTDEEVSWPQGCERVCAGLDWCVAYSWFQGNRYGSSRDPECILHSNLDAGCPKGKAWVKTVHPLNDELAASSSDEVKPDPKGSMFQGQHGMVQICKAKSTSWQGKFAQYLQPGPDTILCKVSKVVMVGQAVMALASLIGNVECYRHSQEESNRRRVAANANITSASALLDELVVENISRGFQNWSLSKAGRTALTQILSRKERTDVSGLQLSKRAGDYKCYLGTSSAGMRWALGSAANYYEKQYQCSELPNQAFKASKFCRSNFLRTLGRGLFGAGLYGFTTIKENCQGTPDEPMKFFCGMDYGKLVIYVGKMIFHVIQIAFLLNADQAWEKASTAMNIGAAMVFMGEAIVRIMGPCLGKMTGNEDRTVIKDGACIGTYLEEAALGVYTTSSAVQTYNFCIKK